MDRLRHLRRSVRRRLQRLRWSEVHPETKVLASALLTFLFIGISLSLVAFFLGGYTGQQLLRDLLDINKGIIIALVVLTVEKFANRNGE